MFLVRRLDRCRVRSSRRNHQQEYVVNRQGLHDTQRCKLRKISTTCKKNIPTQQQNRCRFRGTLKPWHGVPILIEAFSLAHALYPNMLLRIVGTGPQEHEIRKHLANLPIEIQESVELLEHSLTPKFQEFYLPLILAVAPYPDLSDFYYSPLKILEYMAAGRAIVASHIGQIADLLTHEHTGILVKPGSKIELAEALVRLCRDSTERCRLGTAAKAQAVTRHSWNDVVAKVLKTVSHLNCVAR